MTIFLSILIILCAIGTGFWGCLGFLFFVWIYDRQSIKGNDKPFKHEPIDLKP